MRLVFGGLRFKKNKSVEHISQNGVYRNRATCTTTLFSTPFKFKLCFVLFCNMVLLESFIIWCVEQYKLDLIEGVVKVRIRRCPEENYIYPTLEYLFMNDL